VSSPNNTIPRFILPLTPDELRQASKDGRLRFIARIDLAKVGNQSQVTGEIHRGIPCDDIRNLQVTLRGVETNGKHEPGGNILFDVTADVPKLEEFLVDAVYDIRMQRVYFDSDCWNLVGPHGIIGMFDCGSEEQARDIGEAFHCGFIYAAGVAEMKIAPKP
jgi:hypothetical protein